jgi:hypothetical protein
MCWLQCTLTLHPSLTMETFRHSVVYSHLKIWNVLMQQSICPERNSLWDQTDNYRFLPITRNCSNESWRRERRGSIGCRHGLIILNSLLLLSHPPASPLSIHCLWDLLNYFLQKNWFMLRVGKSAFSTTINRNLMYSILLRIISTSTPYVVHYCEVGVISISI